MSVDFWTFRRLSLFGYICLFGGFFGYTTFGESVYDMTHTTSYGEAYVWLAFVLLGSTLVGLKNRKIVNTPRRYLMFLADGAITLILIGVTFFFSTYPGLVRSASVLLIACSYSFWYFTTLYRGKLAPLAL